MPFREYDKFNDKFNARNLSNGMTLPMQKKTLPLQKSLFYKIVSMETIGNRSQPSVALSVLFPFFFSRKTKLTYGCPVA